MKSLLKRFIADEHGATAIEYSLLGALVAIPLIIVLSAAGLALAQTFTIIGNALAGNPSYY